MGLGIKKFFQTMPSRFERIFFVAGNLDTGSFPENPLPRFLINLRLKVAERELRADDYLHNIGSVSPVVSRSAVAVFKRFVGLNPNNIGNWSVEFPRYGTQKLEYEVIHKLIDLYRMDHFEVEGYVTSGGTEGNLYSIWLSKAYLMKFSPLSKMCLLKTTLSHYSIDKACFMYSIDTFDIPLNSVDWSMDVDSLYRYLNTLYEEGYRAFIVSLTLGYTETGTDDRLRDIAYLLNTFKRKYKDVQFSVVIDAALNGLIKPFIVSDFSPFGDSDFFHVISVDFSKFPAIPYPAGAVLYRKKLRRSIEKSVSVFTMKDNTLLGSRPGASVAAIWSEMHTIGKSGYKKIIERQLLVKNRFLDSISKLYPNAILTSTEYGLSCGVIFDSRDSIPRDICERYWFYSKPRVITLDTGKVHRFNIYKFFFLTHVTNKSVDDIIHSLTLGKTYSTGISQ